MNIQHDISLIERLSAELREYLGDDFDPETFWDTLDGETDALDIADRLIANMLSDKSLVEAARVEEKDLATRRKRIEAREEAVKRTLLTLLNATGEKKLERPRATISKRSGSPSVHITDEASIPSQLTKTVTSPDKAAIKKQLQQGEDVPGAELVVGDDTIAVRVV